MEHLRRHYVIADTECLFEKGHQGEAGPGDASRNGEGGRRGSSESTAEGERQLAATTAACDA